MGMHNFNSALKFAENVQKLNFGQEKDFLIIFGQLKI